MANKVQGTMGKRRAVNMTIPEDIISYLDQYAEENLVSRSAAATQIINQFMKKEDKANKGEE